MTKVSWKGSTLLGPVPPALITCGSLLSPNVFTVAWTGIVNTQPPMTYISVRPERFSFPLIEASGEFAINLPTVKLAKAVDFCGVKSGRDTNKWAACGIHPEAASQISAPLLAESPLSLECRVTQKLALGTHHMFLAEIVAVSVDPALLDASGKLCLERAGLLAFAHGSYYELGKRIGTFGHTVRKKPTTKPGKKKN